MYYVSSNIELYTTLLGWVVYNSGWEMLSGTGLVFMPFLVMLYQNIHDPYVSQDIRPPAITSVKRMKWDLITACIVITLFLVPSKALKVDSVQFVSPATFAKPSQKVHPDVKKFPDTKLQKAIADGVNVPIGWLFILSIGNGVNQWIQGSLPHPDDLRGAALHLRSGYVADESLNSRLSQFQNRCHTPAVAKYRRHNDYVDTLVENLDLSMSWYGTNPEGEDIAWMGSTILMGVPGLYKECLPGPQEACPIGSGFWLSRGEEIVYCDAVWVALRKDIIAYAKTDKAHPDETLAWWEKGILSVNTLFSSDSVADNEDFLVRELIMTNGEARTGMDTPDRAYNSTMWQNPLMRGVTNVIKSWDTSRRLHDMSIETGFMAYMGHTGLPMVKALIMMALIWFIPFFFLVAGYHNVTRLMQLIIVFFTVQLLPMFWGLGYWADQTLAQLLYGGSNGVYDYITGHFTGPDRLLLDVITTMFYVIIPTIFIAVMMWAGIQIRELGQVSSPSQTALQNAGNDAATGGPGKERGPAQNMAYKAAHKTGSVADNAAGNPASGARELGADVGRKIASLFPSGKPKS
ncbi:MAG: conjugal transfer protein TraG N-terminal domain-containing protein [Pseudomonadales bacterium]